MIVDGVSDASVLMGALQSIAEDHSDGVRRLILPNGDQLHCANPDMRVFCELESLQQWSPSCISHFGLVYLESDHVLPYTLLIKSWRLREIAASQRTESGGCAAGSIECAAKLTRSFVPALLEVCKRNAKPYMEFSASHLVDMMLRVLSALVAELAALGDSSTHGVPTGDLKMVVAYAGAMALGLTLQTKARAEFNALLMHLVPELTKAFQHQFATTEAVTIFDVGLRFENHRASFFRWDESAVCPPSISGLDIQMLELGRSSSSFPLFGGSVSSARLFIPTRQTISAEAWLVMLGAAKIHVLVVGDAAAGKSRVLRNSSRTLKQSEQYETTTLQMGSALSAQDIQRAIEAGLPRKLKALYCPSAGKKAVLVTLENLNLDTEVRYVSCVC